MTKPWFGNGTQPSIWYGDSRLIYDPTPPDAGLVVFTTSGGTFAPTIQLVSGSTATVEWLDATGNLLASGLTPSITGETVIHMRCSNYDDIATVNLGFNSNDDAGRYNIGASYNKAATDVTGVSGLSYLPNLVRFMAASTQLTGHVDFSGLAHLEYIECFVSRVQSVDLTGCTSLIRLCLEQTWCSSLDLNPVRHTLRDLRAANQTHNGGSLTFVPLDGPMEALYHYCIRDQVAINIYSFANLPVIEEFWAWNTHQSVAIDQPISPVARSFPLNGNTYNQASVDNILLGLATNSSAGSYSTVELSGSAAPSSAGLAAARTLVARGWTVTVTGGIPDEALPEPIAEYGFNEGSGSTAADSSGNSRTLTVNSGAAWSTSIVKNGTASLSGASVTNQPMGPSTMSAKTVMCWFYLTGGQSNLIVSSPNDGYSGLYVWASGIGFWDEPTCTNVSATYASTGAAWAHAAVVQDGTTTVVYLNGVQVASEPLAAVRGMTNASIGHDGNNGDILSGCIDDVRIFDAALTAEQVAYYMNTPVEEQAPEETPPTYSLYDDTEFTNCAIVNETDAYTLGVEFVVTSPCMLQSIRHFQGVGTPNPGSRTAQVWSVPSETPILPTPLTIPGSSEQNVWLSAELDEPILLEAGIYRVGILHPAGSFTIFDFYFDSFNTRTRGPLQLNRNYYPGDYPQAVFTAGSTLSYPTQNAYRARNYMTDVVVSYSELPGTVLARWPLHDSLEDTSGNGRDGTAELADTGVSWTPVYTDGPVAGTRALYFANGNGDASINWGRTGLEPTTLGFTWMAWFKGSYLNNSGGSAIFAKTRAAGSTRSGATIEGYGSNAVFTVLRWRDDLWYSDLNWDISDWHHICVVDTDTERSVYLDGVAVLSEARTVDTSQPFTWEDYPWRTGWNATLAAAGRDMCVSNLRMFHGGLTQAEIQQAMNTYD